MNQWEREARLLYAIIVAGKSADFANNAMIRFFRERRDTESPFEMIRRLDTEGLLGYAIIDARLGNYTKTEKAYRAVANALIDLLTCSPQQLEAIHGIGPKTSRFFIMWIRPNERFAALDVHVLRWLRAQGYNAPKATPPNGAAYAKWEAIFLKEADKRGLTPRELDSQIWDAGRRGAANVIAT